MADLVTIVGPIAVGKGVVAVRLAELLDEQGSTAVLVDVDDVADMVRGQGAGKAGLWPAAHVAHGALVAGWLASAVEKVIAVGNIYDETEQRALSSAVPTGTPVLRVVLDAPLEVTWARAKDDPARGLSRDRDFHERAHARFRTLLPQIPADLTLDATLPVDELAATILNTATRPTGASAR